MTDKFVLLREDNKVEVLTEQTEQGKQLYLTGIFAQAEKLNGNKRIYEKHVLESSVEQYINEYVNRKRAVGELSHPDRPLPALEEAAILIEELQWDGNNVIGKAKVLDTPKGKIVKGLVEGGFNMGVSTRALGTIKEKNGIKYVQEGLIMTAIDCVDSPSGPDCYVSPLMESLTESVWSYQNGILVKEQKQQSFDEALFLEKLEDAIKKMKR